MTVNVEYDVENSALTPFLAREIAIRRNDRGLTLEELAERSQIHRTTLGLIERGKRGISIGVAEKIADGLQCPLSELLLAAEGRQKSTEKELVLRQRVVPDSCLRNADKLFELIRLRPSDIKYAIERTYRTFDVIDGVLKSSGSDPISHLVEYANLSSMLGNILGASLAEASDGLYTRNKPHAYPDLVPQRSDLPELELKTALEKNSAKGHLPKEGTYITFRYVLASSDGEYRRGKENRGDTAWIWEVRVGRLLKEDFQISNTEGDSGKTAVIKSASFKAMPVVFFDNRFFPYSREWNGLKPKSNSLEESL